MQIKDVAKIYFTGTGVQYAMFYIQLLSDNIVYCVFSPVDVIDGLVQNYSIIIANALEILQSCPKPSFCK